ncbi:hypothetical protein WL797_07800 [Leuconostoc mesenteroides]|uniref:hypothetical protein n=1 Tax=Leuconostoc mesenteroides TaxID=1245 RepID=UPI00311EA346
MKVIEMQVYLVGYRKTDNGEWETSGQTYGNQIDAQAVMNKFDEIEAKIGTYLKNNDLSNSDNNDNFFHIVLEDLRKEYSPTVEMTKEDKEVLLDLKSRATFYFFTQTIKKWQSNRAGLQLPYGNLNEDELMQAWLHPETIKIVDE